MNVYLFATVLGLLGLALMAVLGMAHSAGHASQSHAAHSHSGSLKALGTSHGPSPTAGHHAHDASAHAQSAGASALLSLASPRVLLSLVLGFGLTGMLLTHLLPALIVLPLALLGAAAFEGLLIRPYWNFLLKFESRPALTLASVTGGPAQAATDFDRSGAGLISFELNGETRQMLARLSGAPLAADQTPANQTPANRTPAERVRRGDALTIDVIDEAANTCTVRRS